MNIPGGFGPLPEYDLPLRSSTVPREKQLLERPGTTSTHSHFHGVGSPSSNGDVATGHVRPPQGRGPSVPPVALPMLGSAGSSGQSPLQKNPSGMAMFSVATSPDSTNAYLSSNCRQRFAEIEELHDILSMKDHIIRGLGKQLEDLHSPGDERKETHASLLARADRVRIGHEGLRADLGQMKQQRDALLSEAASLKSELSRAKEEGESKALAEDESLRTAKAALEAAQTEFSQQTFDLNRAREALTEVDDQQRKSRSLAEEREAALRTAEASIASLDSTVSARASEADAASTRVRSLEQSGDDMRRSLGRAQQLLEQRTNELRDAREALQQCTSELRRKDAELTSLQNHLQQSRQERPQRSLVEEITLESRRPLAEDLALQGTPAAAFSKNEVQDQAQFASRRSSGSISSGDVNSFTYRDLESSRFDAAKNDLPLPIHERSRTGYRQAALEDPKERSNKVRWSVPLAAEGPIASAVKAPASKASTEVAGVVQALQGAIWEAGAIWEGGAKGIASPESVSPASTIHPTTPSGAAAQGPPAISPTTSEPSAYARKPNSEVASTDSSATPAMSSWVPKAPVAPAGSHISHHQTGQPRNNASPTVDNLLHAFLSQRKHAGVPFRRLDDVGSYLYGSRVVRLTINPTGQVWASANGLIMPLEEFVKMHEEEEQSHLQRLSAPVRPWQESSPKLPTPTLVHPSRGAGATPGRSSSQSPSPTRSLPTGSPSDGPHQVKRLQSAPQLSSFQANLKGSMSLPPSLPDSGPPSWIPQPVLGHQGATQQSPPTREELLAARNSGRLAGQELARQWPVPNVSSGPPQSPFSPSASTQVNGVPGPREPPGTPQPGTPQANASFNSAPGFPVQRRQQLQQPGLPPQPHGQFQNQQQPGILPQIQLQLPVAPLGSALQTAAGNSAFGVQPLAFTPPGPPPPWVLRPPGMMPLGTI